MRFVDEGFGFLPEGSMEQVRRDLDMGYAAMALVFAAPYAGSLPALWFTARSDRTGRRAVVVAGAVLSAVALAAFAAAGSGTALVAASVLWGFGGSLLVHGAELELAAVPVGAPPDELHRRLRATNLWGTAGDVAGPLLLAGVLAAGWSWRAAFWVAAGGTLAYAASLWRHDFAAVAAAPDGDGPPAWRDPVAWRLGAYAFLLMPFDETWLAFLIAWLQVDGGLAPSTAALAGIVAVLGAALGFGPLAARAAHRSDRAVLATCGAVLAVAGSVVAGLPPWMAAMAGLVVNAGTATAWVTVQHAALSLRPGAEGRVLSLVAAIEHTTLVLPIGLGILADRLGLGATFVAYLVLGAALAGAGATTGRRRDTAAHAPGRAPAEVDRAAEAGPRAPTS